MKFTLGVISALAASSFASASLSRKPTSAHRNIHARQDDPQTSLTLDPAVIGDNLALTGVEGGGDPGQVASLTSTNNFINFCLDINLPITNGEQVIGGSCNPIPMGVIVAKANMPSSKFQNPKNGDVIAPNTEFTIEMAVSKMQTGNFVNPQVKYFAAPQQVNGQGIIIAHSHVVVEKISSLDSTEVLDPNVFAFFKGLNGQAQNGVLSATVTGGLPEGTYRLSSINTDANHTPILVAVAQHGSLDDVVYFTVGAAPAGGDNGAGNGNDGGAGGNDGGAGGNDGGNQNNGGAGGNGGNAGGNGGAAAASTTAAAVTSAAAATSSAPAAATTSAAGNGNGNNGGGRNNNNGGGRNNNGGGRNNNGGGGRNGGRTTGNLQRFTEALGNVVAPVVTPNGARFAVQGNNQDFNDVQSAIRRSCDVQNNLCANFVNGSRGTAGFSVGDCNAQQGRCLQLAGQA